MEAEDLLGHSYVRRKVYLTHLRFTKCKVLYCSEPAPVGQDDFLHILAAFKRVRSDDFDARGNSDFLQRRAPETAISNFLQSFLQLDRFEALVFSEH